MSFSLTRLTWGIARGVYDWVCRVPAILAVSLILPTRFKIGFPTSYVRCNHGKLSIETCLLTNFSTSRRRSFTRFVPLRVTFSPIPNPTRFTHSLNSLWFLIRYPLSANLSSSNCLPAVLFHHVPLVFLLGSLVTPHIRCFLPADRTYALGCL